LAPVALLAGLLLARQAVVSSWDTIWAEDGFAFLSDALSGNALGAVVQPHGGYIHPLPRGRRVLPLDLAAVVFSDAMGARRRPARRFVYAASGEILRSRALRVMLAALTALLPAAGSELLGSTADFQLISCPRVLPGVRWRKTTTRRSPPARWWSPSQP
jgi:hypothetical protein